jgi:hypothetical protein
MVSGRCGPAVLASTWRLLVAAASAKSRVPRGMRVAPVLGRRRSECDSVAPRYATHAKGDHEYYDG